MKIFIGSDHGGFEMKEEIKKYLKELNHEIIDLGCNSQDSCDYPEFGTEVAKKTVEENAKGIVICGTGIGISIATNKVRGARAALCTNATLARLTREHNDANILAMGGRIIGIEVAKDIVKTFIETKFSNDERHQRRINKIEA